MEVSEETSSKQTVKRKVGRPRKHEKAQTIELVDDKNSVMNRVPRDLGINHIAAASVIDKTTGIVSSRVPLGKKRKISTENEDAPRPKRSKTGQSKEGARKSMTSSQEASYRNKNNVVTVGPKRKRGRPKGTVGKSKMGQITDTEKSFASPAKQNKKQGKSRTAKKTSAKSKPPDQKTTATAKKKVGRPPKKDKFKCKQCEFVGKDKIMLKKHMYTHRKHVFKCKFCDFVTTSETYLLQHDTTHTNIKHFNCDVCGFVSRVKKDMQRHKTKHSDKKNFQCPHCDFTTKWRTNIRQHVLKHATDRPYKCKICSASFKRMSDLRYHLYRHNDNKPLKCQKCEFRCKTNYELKFHQHKHSNYRPFRCTHPDCKFASKTRTDLRKHLKTHSNVRNFECPLCGRAYKTASARNKHIKRHSDERPFMCEICNKRFKTKPCVYKHMYLHLDTKPFTCDVCQKGFSSKSNMISHKVTHNTTNRPFRCPICPYWGSSKNHLLAHIGTMHGHSFAYFCEFCKKPFKRYASLKIHYSRMHTAVELEHIPTIFDLKPLHLEHIKTEKDTGQETKQMEKEATGMITEIKKENYISSDAAEKNEVNESSICRSSRQTNQTLLSTGETEGSLSGSCQKPKLETIDDDIESSLCQNTTIDERYASCHSSGSVEDEHIPVCNERSCDEAKSVENSYAPCSATLAMYDGFRLPLATKGFKFNLDKNGKKPKSWFMNPVNIEQPEEQLRQLEYMWKKKLQSDPHMKRKPSVYKRYSKEKKISYLKRRLRTVDDYCPEAKPIDHKSRYESKNYVQGLSSFPEDLKNNIDKANLNQKPKLLTVPVSVSDEVSRSIKKIPLSERLMTIPKTEPENDVTTDKESISMNKGGGQKQSRELSGVGTSDQFIQYYYKGKPILATPPKCEKPDSPINCTTSENVAVQSDSEESLEVSAKGQNVCVDSQTADTHTTESDTNVSEEVCVMNVMKVKPMPLEYVKQFRQNMELQKAHTVKEPRLQVKPKKTFKRKRRKSKKKSASAGLTSTFDVPVSVRQRASAVSKSSDKDLLEHKKQKGQPKSLGNNSNVPTLRDKTATSSETVQNPPGQVKFISDNVRASLMKRILSRKEENNEKERQEQILSSHLQKLREKPACVANVREDSHLQKLREKPACVANVREDSHLQKLRLKPACVANVCEDSHLQKLRLTPARCANVCEDSHLQKLREKHARLANVREDCVVMVEPKSKILHLSEEEHAKQILEKTKNVVLENSLTSYGKTRMKIDRSVTQKFKYVHRNGGITNLTSKGKVVPYNPPAPEILNSEGETVEMKRRLVKEIKILTKQATEANEVQDKLSDDSALASDICDKCLDEEQADMKDVNELHSCTKDCENDAFEQEAHEQGSSEPDVVDGHVEGPAASVQQSNGISTIGQTQDQIENGNEVGEMVFNDLHLIAPFIKPNTKYLVIPENIGDIQKNVNTCTVDSNQAAVDSKPDINSLDTSFQNSVNQNSVTQNSQVLTFVPVIIKETVDASTSKLGELECNDLSNLASSTSIPHDGINQIQTSSVDENATPVDVKFYADDVSLKQKKLLDNSEDPATRNPVVKADVNDENIVIGLQHIKEERYLDYEVTCNVESNQNMEQGNVETLKQEKCLDLQCVIKQESI